MRDFFKSSARFKLHALGGDSGGGTTQTIQKADPWGPQQPYLQDIMGQANALYQWPGPTYYPGQEVAQFAPEQEAGLQATTAAATGVLPDLAGTAAGANKFLLGDVLYPQSNPAMEDYMRSAIRPVFENLTQSVLPNIGSAAQAGGAYGGARHGLALGEASSGALRTAGDITSRIASEGYGQGLQAMTQGLALAPQTGQFTLTPGTTLEAVGRTRQAQEQANIDADMRKWAFEQNLPYEKLREYASLVSGGLGGETTTTSPSPSSNPALAGLGGAMTGASLAATLAPGFALGGPVGAGVGLLLGLMGS